MGTRTLRASIRSRVYAQLRSRLNSVGMNVTDGRVSIVMDRLRDGYGYENVTDQIIGYEAAWFVEEIAP